MSDRRRICGVRRHRVSPPAGHGPGRTGPILVFTAFLAVSFYCYDRTLATDRQADPKT
jgi:hypothetical protein